MSSSDCDPGVFVISCRQVSDGFHLQCTKNVSEIQTEHNNSIYFAFFRLSTWSPSWILIASHVDPPPIINLGFVSEREDYPFSGLLSVFFQWRRWRWVFRCRFSRCSLGTSGFCSLFGGEAVMTTTVPLLRTCDTILTTSPPLTKSNVQEINA